MVPVPGGRRRYARERIPDTPRPWKGAVGGNGMAGLWQESGYIPINNRGLRINQQVFANRAVFASLPARRFSRTRRVSAERRMESASGFRGVEHQKDAQLRIARASLFERIQGDAQGLLPRVAIGAGGNQRKRDTGKAALGGQRKRAAV